MIKCPNCGGYGQTVSTRNDIDKVIRYHKCRDCENTFTSTQIVNKEKDNIVFSINNINDILLSDEFKFVTSKIFTACNLHGNFIESKIISDNEFELLSNKFYNTKTDQYDVSFIMQMKLHQNNIEGVIKIVEDNYTIACIGIISYNNSWNIDLDIRSINKVINLNT